MSKDKILIVEARFYDDIVEEMVQGAVEVIEKAGFEYERIPVPGVFEVPGVIAMALHSMEARSSDRYAGFIALGCVIRGETTHYDYVCSESARGLMDLSTRYDAAIGYGILTVENRDQAWARASRKEKNKGYDAAEACLRMIDIKRELRLLPS